MIILPYAKTSISSKKLARALGCKRIAVRRNTYRHNGQPVVNWGYSGYNTYTRWGASASEMLNNPRHVRKASNKIECLEILSHFDVPTLGFTTSREEAQRRLDDMEVSSIYVRHEVSSSSGRGIEVINFGEQVPEAPLYTDGLHKWTEWRFHVGSTQDVYGNNTWHKIAVQQKVKRNTRGLDAGTDDIRNHGSDYIFKRNGLDIPDFSDGLQCAGEALSALGLDFAGIDMAHTNEGWKVIEVNTAPGLTGSTIIDYCNYFKEVL